MTKPNTPVDGPYRITVEPLPTGVTLDVEAFVQGVVHDVVEALLTDKYADRFDALHELQPRDPHVIERPADLPFEQLVEDLVSEVRTKLPVYGLQTLRLAGRIEQLATPAIAALQAQAAVHAVAVDSIVRGEGSAAA
ncbi:hypothetical protein [Streptomyces sp. NBC_00038]|uniref:hypothetical protein n=1 Tax=Streptomyces sp. NBC_00038 TaxID=2903615 RepID=UPI00224EF951|nr:hypothetical protein [Streptomyces sp. NBC_00038]MCX5562765.1 hypothetical protein [Streptomyces sp. NBC_00038]MCX5563585.1 hypothetical protein [Streptomyces sp. NBC_00038]